MKKIYLTIASMMAIMSLQAQVVEQSDSRWLQRNPASPKRAERLLDIERKQIVTSGTYNVSPFAEPRLEQIAPSQQHEQYFYEGQRELYHYNADPTKNKSDLNSLRQKYLRLYEMNDPEYQSEARYYLGYIEYLDGNYDAALRYFKSLNPDSKYIYTVPFYEMQIAYLKGEYNDALDACNRMEDERYLYTNEQLTEATRIKAECLLVKGYREDALKHFRLYLDQIGTPLPTSAYNAAILEFEQQEYGKAAQLASVATQSEQELLRQYAYMLVGQSELKLNQIPEARLAFEQAAHGTDKEMNEAAAYNLCAIAHESNQSVWGDEIHILEEFLNSYPASKYSDSVMSFLSEAYTTTKNYDAALASINKIRQPNNLLLKAKQRILYQLGIQHYVNGEFEKSGSRFTECIQMGDLQTDTRAVAYFWRGDSRYHLGQYSGAISDYANFVSQNPKEVQAGLLAAAYYNQGYAYMKLQDYVNAINCFRKYVDCQEEQGTASYNDGMVRLADCYYYNRQFSEAETCYHNVAEAAGIQSDYALYQEALMMGLQKKYDQKQDILDNLIARYPNSEFIDDAWLDKGRTALLTSNNNLAINAFTQIINKYADSPIAPQAAVQLAMTYNNMGKSEEAQRIYQLVADRYPDTDAAAVATEDLKTLNIQLRIASLPRLYAAGQYKELLDTYQQLVQQNVDFRDRQNMQLLAGKSSLALQDYQQANQYLTEASQELRTASGAEAKFLLAQMAFDRNDVETAQTVNNELLHSGTPHQYWLARGIILTSDIYAKQGETFMATEYLKSLKQNYTQEDDIQNLVSSRLSKLEPNTTAETTESVNE